MANLNKSIKEILSKDHPILDPDQLSEGENILYEEKNGTKYTAQVKKGKIVHLAVVSAKGKEGTVVRIQPPTPILPNHVLVCMCEDTGMSTVLGEGVRCWNQLQVGEKPG